MVIHLVGCLLVARWVWVSKFVTGVTREGVGGFKSTRGRGNGRDEERHGFIDSILA
jgi:hypothetical protein